MKKMQFNFDNIVTKIIWSFGTGLIAAFAAAQTSLDWFGTALVAGVIGSLLAFLSVGLLERKQLTK